MLSSDWVRLFGTLLATFVGAYLAYYLASRRERERDERLHATLRRAIRAEIAKCGNQAITYIEEKKLAPAYRLPMDVHDAVFSQLVASGELDVPQVTAIIEFYSQVKQVNWCIDKIQRHLEDKDSTAAQKEFGRALAKAEELKAPQSRFYTPVAKALRLQG